MVPAAGDWMLPASNDVRIRFCWRRARRWTRTVAGHPHPPGTTLRRAARVAWCSTMRWRFGHRRSCAS